MNYKYPPLTEEILIIARQTNKTYYAAFDLAKDFTEEFKKQEVLIVYAQQILNRTFGGTS